MKNIETIIEQLWYGELNPKKKVLKNEEIERLSKEIDYLHLEISGKMDEELLDQFNEYELVHGEYERLRSEHAFKEGFATAIQLITAAFSTDVK